MAIVAAVAGAVITGYFSSRESESQQRNATQRSREDRLFDEYINRLNRRDTLEDRRYKEEALGGYRDFYRGNRQLSSPAYTDPGPMPERPYDLQNSNRKKPKG